MLVVILESWLCFYLACGIWFLYSYKMVLIKNNDAVTMSHNMRCEFTRFPSAVPETRKVCVHP